MSDTETAIDRFNDAADRFGNWIQNDENGFMFLWTVTGLLTLLTALYPWQVNIVQWLGLFGMWATALAVTGNRWFA